MLEPLIFRLLVFILLVVFMLHRAYYTRKFPAAESETLEKIQPGPLSKIASLIFLLALASSLREIALPPDLVVFGELGLTGEVRPVTFGEERIREAAKPRIAPS